MDNNNFAEAVLFEHQFWLQIMGDHSRFIFFSLAPTETQYLLAAQEFILLFDQLLDKSHKLNEDETQEFNKTVYETTYRLREFKIELLSMSLTADLKSHLSPSFINDMLNELEEYLYLLSNISNNKLPIFHPLHYHMLWLTDAVEHAASVSSELDFAEKELIDRAYRFELQFQDFNTKALLMNGYQRTQLETYPALDRFSEQVAPVMNGFMEFLENLRDQRIDKRVLGTLMPLMADHMAREECYYLWKLSQSSSVVRKPSCDPTRPRLEA